MKRFHYPDTSIRHLATSPTNMQLLPVGIGFGDNSIHKLIEAELASQARKGTVDVTEPRLCSNCHLKILFSIINENRDGRRFVVRSFKGKQ